MVLRRPCARSLLVESAQTGETGAADHPNGYLPRPHASAPARTGAAFRRPRSASRRDGGRHPAAEGSLPRRPVGPLHARWRLVFAWRRRRPGPEARMARRSLTGLAAATVPSASNAGDFSVPSYLGTVHWYRKDFGRRRARAPTSGRLRFESVNYRAKVWLNGKPLGSTWAPTCRSRCARRDPQQGRQPPGRAGRQPAQEVRHPAALAIAQTVRSRAAGGTTTGFCGRSICGGSTPSTSSA